MRWFHNLGYRVSKSGFGLIEVLAAAVVLGFLIVGLTRLQLGNREVVLRIRARDAAQIVAQDFIDNLSRQGISSINEEEIEDTKTYEWKGKNGEITSEIKYTINAKISDDEKALNSVERSNFTEATKADTTHIVAKKVNLTVSWPSKGSTQSINVSRIIK